VRKTLLVSAAALLGWMALIPQSGRAAPAASIFEAPKPPYSIEKLRSWHRMLGDWPWSFPPEQKVRLRSDGVSQRMICSEGGSRSGMYVLFHRERKEWRPISGPINQAHHPVRILSRKVSGWHDFETFLPLWGSGERDVMRVHYRWMGRRYSKLSTSTGMWCDFEPFKSDKDVCEH
jgi:hypothetical protein